MLSLYQVLLLTRPGQDHRADHHPQVAMQKTSTFMENYTSSWQTDICDPRTPSAANINTDWDSVMTILIWMLQQKLCVVLVLICLEPDVNTSREFPPY